MDSPEAFHLFGATRVFGFLLAEDDRGNDCVLIVRKEPHRPALRLDDFAVAYDNATHSSGRPGCTINPRSAVLRKLSNLTSGLGSASDMKEINRIVREFERIARADQDVIVFGVEPDTHLAQVTVDADYDLKGICNGNEEIAIIKSLMDIIIGDIRANLRRSGDLNMPLTTLNRFWFNAGKVSYRTSGDRFILTQCPVVLLTEEESLTPGGRMTGKGTPNPHAKEFCDAFNSKFQDIAKQKPIYRKLENVYRFMALAELLNAPNVRGRAAPVIESLLEDVRVPSVTPRETLPGTFAVGKLDEIVPRLGGRVHLRLPCCGGVHVGIHRHQMHRETDATRIVDRVATTTISSRPSPTAVTWSFHSDALAELVEQ